MVASVVPARYVACYKNFFRDFPNFNVNLKFHARKRMRQRNIQLPQILTILRSGSLVRVESDIKSGLDQYRVSGRDADGRRLEIVVNLVESGTGRVDVITVID